MAQPPHHGPYEQQPGAPVPDNPYASPPPQLPPPHSALPAPGHAPTPHGRTHTILTCTLAAVVALGMVFGGARLLFGDRLSLPGGDASAAHPTASATASSGQQHSHRRTSRMAWQAKAPADAKAKDHIAVDARGTWFTAKLVVKAEERRLKAYDRTSGKTVHSLTLPGKICGNRAAPQQGSVALAFARKGDVCDRLTLVDLKTFERRWTKATPSRIAGEDAYTVVHARVRGTLYHAAAGRLTAYRAADGEHLWSRQAPKGWRYVELSGGTRLFSVLQQGATAASKRVNPSTVQELSPADGSVRWTWRLPKNRVFYTFAETSPLVLGLAVKGDFKPVELVALSRQGTTRSRIRIASERLDDEGRARPRYEPDCVWGAYGCRELVVADDRVHLATASEEGQGDTPWTQNKLVAFRLSDGKVAWSKTLATKREGAPLAVDGGKVLVYLRATKESGGRLLGVDPRNGASALYQQHPDADSEREYMLDYPTAPPARYVDRGQFFLVEESLPPGSGDAIVSAWQ